MEKVKVSFEIEADEKEKIDRVKEAYNVTEKELLFLGYKMLLGSSQIINEWKKDNMKFIASPIASKSLQDKIKKSIKNGKKYGRYLTYWYYCDYNLDESGEKFVWYDDLCAMWVDKEKETSTQFDNVTRLMNHDKIIVIKKDRIISNSNNLESGKNSKSKKSFTKKRIYISKSIGADFVIDFCGKTLTVDIGE